MKKIKDGLYLKQNFLGDDILVRPYKDEDGSINWKHLLIGTWSNMILLLFILISIVYLTWAYNTDMATCDYFTEQLRDNSSLFCNSLMSGNVEGIKPLESLDLSQFEGESGVNE